MSRVVALAAVAFLVWTPASAQEEGRAPAEGEATPAPEGEEAPAEGEEAAPAEEVGEVEADEGETESVEDALAAMFDAALDDHYNELYPEAAAAFWGYMKAREERGDTGGNYEWAQFFLAESLRGLGLWHGALQYYYVVAKTRQRPETLPEALGRLEEISRTRPFSETLVFEDLIYDSEFGTLPGHLQEWVDYVQGLYDYRNNFVDWGQRHFAAIPAQTYYGALAAYVEAVYALKHGKEDTAKRIFELLLENLDKGEVEAPEIRNKTNLALARLLFDTGEFEKALAYYEKVVQIALTFEQAQLLMEKAWAYFYLKKYRKAMGLLHALDAPSYERFFMPDAFVLRGFILKDLCHTMAAKREVRRFRSVYSRSLEDLRQRRPLALTRRIFHGATQEGAVAMRTDLLRSLEQERRAIERYDSFWEDDGLDQHLRRIYDFEMREQARLWHLQFERVGDETALALLESAEQINLLDYETGLDIFTRYKAGQARKDSRERLVVPYDSRNVYYEFDVEYWNDELHSYQYFIVSRCFDDRGEGEE